MAVSKKSYIDLLGLSKFKELLLKTSIDPDKDSSISNKTPTVGAIINYVNSVESEIVSAVDSSLNSKVNSVSYDTTNKKFTYTTGSGTSDIVTVATLKSAIGAMTGATASASGTMGLVPAPSSGKQNYFLRGDGTWVVPTNTTYTFASGTTKGAFSVTPSGGSAKSVSIYGLGSAAYTESSAYAPASHNHDASYYTKTEVDTKLDGKSNTEHTHTIANITDLGTATSDTLGLVKSSPIGTDGKNYAVGVSSIDGTMKVNIPWTDKNVFSKASNTTIAYLVGSSNSSDETGTLIKDTNIYLDSTAGKLVAPTFKGNLDGNASTATQLKTSRNITVKDADNTNSASAVAFDGSKDITLNMPSTIKASTLMVGSTSSYITRNSSTGAIEIVV